MKVTDIQVDEKNKKMFVVTEECTIQISVKKSECEKLMDAGAAPYIKERPTGQEGDQ